ncbi:MAG: stage III sporulation protein D [Ruminococcaceae bacterium]|nr:stage III sporulation protein D [Oscillospiraceae bacterium]
MRWNAAERCVELGQYIVENKETVRAAAKHFGISKSSVHKDVTEKLREVDRILYNEVKRVLEENKSQRHLRGGMATKRKYEELSRAKQELLEKKGRGV